MREVLCLCGAEITLEYLILVVFPKISWSMTINSSFHIFFSSLQIASNIFKLFSSYLLYSILRHIP